MNTPIREFLNYYYTLSWFNFIFLKMQKRERFELIIYAAFSLILAVIAICKLPKAAHGDTAFGASLGLCLVFSGLLGLRGALLDMKTGKLLELEYDSLFSTGDQFSRYALKVRLLKKELQRLDCYAKEPIDALINVLKYEASVPVYQPTWPKVFSALFFVILGAYLSFYAGIAPKEDLKPLVGLIKVTSALLFSGMAIIFILDVTLVKLVADWRMRSKYHVELIRFLEEIRWDIVRLKSERSPDQSVMQKADTAELIPKTVQESEPNHRSARPQAKTLETIPKNPRVHSAEARADPQI